VTRGLISTTPPRFPEEGWCRFVFVDEGNLELIYPIWTCFTAMYSFGGGLEKFRLPIFSFTNMNIMDRISINVPQRPLVLISLSLSFFTYNQ
jgi:hypothetical protein